LEFAELHPKSVEEQETTGKAVAAAEDQLDRFHRLDGADNARQHAEHSAFSARRHKTGRGRFGIQAAVARTVGHAENGGLALETENRAVDIRLAEQDARIVYQIARWEIVGAVDDDVEIFEQLERVSAGELRFEAFDLNSRIQIREARLR